MADQSHGYNASVGYSMGFFREMAPDWMDFCVRAKGSELHRTGPAYRYLDLGCGQGFHVCLLAAANPRAEFVGIDFLAEHIAHASDLAAAAGLTNVRFLEADLLDLASTWPTELGTFDYIVLQGILSWVSPSVRAAAIRCIAQASQDGTLVYFGYNMVPKWLSSIPFQHVANRIRQTTDDISAIEQAAALFQRLQGANAPIFASLPGLKTRIEGLPKHPKNYLAHEYLTDHWTLFWHSQLADELQAADLSYVAPATVAETLLPASLPSSLREIVESTEDQGLAEDVQGLMLNQGFRRDIFARGLSPAEGGADFDVDAPIHLMIPPQEGRNVDFQTSVGGMTVEYAVVADIVAALLDGPKPAGELLALANPTRRDTRQILLLMLEANMLAVGARQPGDPAIAHRFNAAVARGASEGIEYRYVAAANLGTGISVSELDLLFIDTWIEAGGAIDVHRLAAGVSQRLKTLDRQLTFVGRPVGQAELDARIAEIATIFLEQMVPQWRRVGVLE